MKSVLADIERLKVQQNQEMMKLKRKVRSQEQVLQDLGREVKKQRLINVEQNRVIQEPNEAIQDLQTIINSREGRSGDMGSLRQGSFDEELLRNSQEASAPRSSSVQCK